MTGKDIVIKNGNRLKEWIVFAGSLLSAIVAGTLLWAALCGRVDSLEKDSVRLHEEGTKVSQANQREIISIKADVKYTREAVDEMKVSLKEIKQAVRQP